MSKSENWVKELPKELQEKVKKIQDECPSSKQVFSELCSYFIEKLEAEQKKRKVSTPQEGDNNGSGGGDVTHPSILPQEIIFELPSLSFSSPIRKKMNMTFHLKVDSKGNPIPILSIVNPQTMQIDFSIQDLKKSVRLCVLIPVLGNTTNPSKRNTGQLCFWLKNSTSDPHYKSDPIICQLNFDNVKKQLIKTGKIPAEAENQLVDTKEDETTGIKLISEAIVSFLQRQFQLCGIQLINYLPSSNPVQNQLTINTDNGIALSQKANSVNNIVLVEAYKGAKEGSLMFLAGNEFNHPFIIFGFKKPILLFDIQTIKHVSYSNITRLTFSLTITYENSMKDSKIETAEFSMIDQQYYQAVDDFVKAEGINDNSFDDKLREKGTHNAQDAKSGTPNANSDDEEEDGTFQLGAEQEEVEEEFNSNAESDAEQEVGPEEASNDSLKKEDVKDEVI